MWAVWKKNDSDQQLILSPFPSYSGVVRVFHIYTDPTTIITKKIYLNGSTVKKTPNPQGGMFMHFQISGSELLSLVSLVEKAVAPTDAVPALTGIHCAAKDDKLTLTANNLQLAIQSSAPCTVFKPGEYILDGRLFAELVRKLPSDNVVMEYKNDQVAITAATMEFFLNTIIADEFPAYPKCSEKVLAITDRELERLIRNSSFATSTDDHQPIFSGVLVEIGEEGFQFIATDSNRLAYAKAASGEAQVQNRQFIVPKANLLELNRCLPLTEEVVQVFMAIISWPLNLTAQFLPPVSLMVSFPITAPFCLRNRKRP